jgi:hypothetical protein
VTTVAALPTNLHEEDPTPSSSEEGSPDDDADAVATIIENGGDDDCGTGTTPLVVPLPVPTPTNASTSIGCRRQYNSARMEARMAGCRGGVLRDAMLLFDGVHPKREQSRQRE